MKQTAVKRHKSKPFNSFFPHRAKSAKETKSSREKRIIWRKWQNKCDRFFNRRYEGIFSINT